jgi:hypothetical protein
MVSGPDAQGWLRWCFASQDTARLPGAWSAIGQAIIKTGWGPAFVCLRRHAGQHTTSGHFIPCRDHCFARLSVQERKP